MKVPAFILTGLLCGLLLQPVAAQTGPAHNRPNIILIMSDDMGYSDLGCYGSEISTPNLDSLAMTGLRYTRFHNMGHCCPSRAALMTGLYPHQTGLGWMTGTNFHLPGFTDELNEHCVTIAEVLKTAGYATLMAGKWHLSHNIHAGGPQHDWPLQRGFEKFYGILTGAGNYYDPASLCRDNTLITPLNDPEYHPQHFYFTNAITDNAVRFMQERPKDKPFFMYVAYTTAHWPMQAPEEAIEKYKGKYDAGWDVLRRQRFEREKALGVIDKDATLSPSDTHPWAEEKDKAAMARRMETYAAMITIMDQGIGKIVDELKKEGIFDNTVIVFLQDNGGNAEGTGFGGPEGETRPVVPKNAAALKPLGKDEVQYAINPPVTRDGKRVMQGKNVMAGPADTYLAYLKPWGNLSNTPFRKYKNFVYEGGVATPLIIHWPDGIKAERGAVRTQSGHEIDLMPTIAQLAGAKYPSVYKGNEITPVSGISLIPTFEDKPLPPERAIYWSHQANRAMLMGKWKIVSGGILNGPYGKWKTYVSLPWQLYDMENDRSEMRDLSAEHPDIVKKMAAMWDKWAHSTNVYPMPWKEVKPPLRPDYMSTPWEYPDF
ncbi:arylsulfatase [Compostibacter hankyongensis]